MAGIKVETDQLMACANTYKQIADQFNQNCESIIKSVAAYDDVWKGSFAEDLDEKVKKLKNVQKSVYSNSIQLHDFIVAAVNKYIQVDRGLADKSTIGNADYPDNVKVSVHVKNENELKDVYNRSNQIASGMTRNTDGSISCASLTKAKAQANGFDTDWSGNGNQVYGNIREGEHGNYIATKYPGGNCLKDMIGKEGSPITDIVVSFPKDPKWGDKYGHVLYIDQIVDGKVFYTDNRNPTSPRVAASIDEFLAKYAPYNGSPVGCVHLKKK